MAVPAAVRMASLATDRFSRVQTVDGFANNGNVSSPGAPDLRLESHHLGDQTSLDDTEGQP
jgi:hypothetical protein